MNTPPMIKASEDGLEISVAGARRLFDLVLQKQEEAGLGDHPNLIHQITFAEMASVAPVHVLPKTSVSSSSPNGGHDCAV